MSQWECDCMRASFVCGRQKTSKFHTWFQHKLCVVVYAPFPGSLSANRPPPHLWKSLACVFVCCMRVYIQMAGLDAPYCSLGCSAGVRSAWLAGQVWGEGGKHRDGSGGPVWYQSYHKQASFIQPRAHCGPVKNQFCRTARTQLMPHPSIHSTDHEMVIWQRRPNFIHSSRTAKEEVDELSRRNPKTPPQEIMGPHFVEKRERKRMQFNSPHLIQSLWQYLSVTLSKRKS